MTQENLEQLVRDKQRILAALKLANDAIAEAQVLSEYQMKMFGFDKLTEVVNIVIYGKKVNDVIYEVMLDLINPYIVTIHRQKQVRSFTFDIGSIEDFKDLLILMNII